MRADVVFVDPALPLGLVGPRLAGLPWLVVLARRRDHGARDGSPARAPRWRRVLRRADGVVAAGEYPAREAVRAAGRPLPGVVIPPGVDVDRFTPARDAAEIRVAAGTSASIPSWPTVVGVSRLVPRKGFDVLLDAVALLELEVQVVIAGGGPRSQPARSPRRAARPRLRAPRSSAGCPTTTSRPSTGPPTSSAMVCRERWGGLEAEGFGIVFLEAAACGVPAIAGRSGGSHEAVVDGETGFVVDPGDVTALAQTLERVLVDRVLRHRLGTAARTFAVGVLLRRTGSGSSPRSRPVTVRHPLDL